MEKKQFLITITGQSELEVSESSTSIFAMFVRGIVIAISEENAKSIALNNVKKGQQQKTPNRTLIYRVNSCHKIELDFLLADEKLIINR